MFFFQEWSKIRDDLELDDLKDLPAPIPVQCAIPNGFFGDFMMVLEFFLAFGEELQLKDAFPGGLTFELLERAVIENEVSGPLSDILQVLLSSLFEFQDAESEEVKEAQSTTTALPDSEVSEGGLTYQVLNRFFFLLPLININFNRVIFLLSRELHSRNWRWIL